MCLWVTSSLASNSHPNSQSSPRQRHSIVIYGIKEQPQGTHFDARMDADDESVFQLLNSLTSICKSSNQECLRLGRYRVGMSRPLKVTFMKTILMSLRFCPTSRSWLPVLMFH